MRRWGVTFDRDDSPDEGSVNLTPLIDVVFVVLIMFILVAPLVELDRINLAPAAEEKSPDMVSFQDSAPIKIHVYADNTIFLNGTATSAIELSTLLKRAYRLYPDTRPQLYHDEEAYFGTYQSVKNAVESAGFEALDIILKSS
ncbi:MAG: Biopolymer transport protein ExbD [Chlamydiae bacterium]|nr:Biopolymer transport protein ExbD [Chlamydiota bacterium]